MQPHTGRPTQSIAPAQRGSVWAKRISLGAETKTLLCGPHRQPEAGPRWERVILGIVGSVHHLQCPAFQCPHPPTPTSAQLFLFQKASQKCNSWVKELNPCILNTDTNCGKRFVNLYSYPQTVQVFNSLLLVLFAPCTPFFSWGTSPSSSCSMERALRIDAEVRAPRRAVGRLPRLFSVSLIPEVHEQPPSADSAPAAVHAGDRRAHRHRPGRYSRLLHREAAARTRSCKAPQPEPREQHLQP